MKEASPVAKEKPSQAGASQQAWRQAAVEDARVGAPGARAEPARVPTKSMRGRVRKMEDTQYGDGDGDGVGAGWGSVSIWTVSVVT